jgi:Family of unknown function (DUF6428)
MKLSAFKQHLDGLGEVNFIKENGKSIPKHFHITEIGQIDKRFMDCGGTLRKESVISMQLWESVDFWHRLEPQKLSYIIDLSIEKLLMDDLEIEVEYQSESIEKFGLGFENGNFILSNKTTACLATQNCGIPVEKIKTKISEVVEAAAACCTPGGGCC